ncbi:M20 family metallopeptidase [Brevibacillus fulvus]|uniref:Glutamate carboxypeptidase n=1 Tax=Brevibacillus fulvus TaxID=1125967 RepID=A0A938Y5C9_9BACL|nr:M20 family metallopeptidase [Brevibacillus fulvus]MBM7591550.1 glutamate carboxypeptidase [Brevibacillus fulvus]
MSELYTYLQKNQLNILQDIETVVKAESPSNVKAAVDRCGAVLASLFQKYFGVDPVVYPQTNTGDHMRFAIGEGEGQILILGHFDTVWDIGRLSYRIEGNKAYGPGIFDMKGGIVQSLWAIKACRELDLPIRKKIVFLCTSDEEIGSGTSRAIIEEEARKSEVVLVAEPPVAQSGALKTSRKGVGMYTVAIKGKAAHAGNHHQDGISAVEEMARQIIYLHSLTDYEKGTTLNVGIAQGGSRRNVVAESAEAFVDLRVSSMEEAERIDSLLRQLQPHQQGVTIEVNGSVSRPPMEKSEQTDRLFRLARECGTELGLDLKEAFVGGGSDGNFTAAVGVPTLDGLGVMGDGPHAEYEHILIDQLPIRAALFAKLLIAL